VASSTIFPVILSGGSGTRLWPLSRTEHPKQFHALVGDETLFQQAVRSTAGIAGDVRPPIVICNELHSHFVTRQLAEIGVLPGAVVLEPKGRNTAPAVAAAAHIALSQHAAADEPLLLVLAADHVIQNPDAFHAAVAAAAVAARDGFLVTFGVVPSKPETGYGYLLTGESRGAWSLLERFVEKPDLATAERYVSSGRYLWNSGMFLLPARTYLSELEKFEPDMASTVAAAVAESRVDGPVTHLGESFVRCPADSIDFAVMEKTQLAAVVPLDAGWSDVGSWAALHEVLDKDDSGNVLQGDVVAENCRDSFVASSTRTVGVVGLEGIIVIETEHSVLVMSREKGQELKSLVEKLKKT